MVALNVILLGKCKKVIVCVTKVTFHGNHHSLVSIFPDISLLIKHLIENIVFEKQLGRGMKKKAQLSDVFSKSTTNISSRVKLENYLNCARGN